MKYDLDLELALDAVGRQEAISRAKSLGWVGPPPKYVWWNIVVMMRYEQRLNADEAP